MEEFIYIDLEPVYISLDKQEWVHPDVAELVEWEKPDWADGPKDTELYSSKPVYRVYLTNEKGKTCYIVFVSEWFDQKEAKQISEQLLNAKFDLTEEEGEALVSALAVTLHDDVWCPGGDQFLNTKMHRKIQRTLGQRWHISFLSPDVALCKNGDDVSFCS